MTQTTPEQIEERILTILDEALNMRLELDEDESVYNITYISNKVAKCARFQERLSDMTMELTKIQIPLSQLIAGEHARLRRKTEELKASAEYENEPRSNKTAWLSNQLEADRDTEIRWSALKTAVSQVKEAVVDRASTMKRLDSDLRLQSKLYEQKVAAGATPPPTFNGDKDEGLDLD